MTRLDRLARLQEIADVHGLWIDASREIARLYDDGSHVATVSLARGRVRALDAVRGPAVAEALGEVFRLGQYEDKV